MARIHQNGCRARAGKVGQLPHIILWRNRFIRRKIPLHANYVVPGCPNRTDHCKWGLFPSEEGVQGRRCTPCGAYVDLRWIRLAVAIPPLESQSRFIDYR